MSTQPLDLITNAVNIARRAHTGQFRRNGITAYICHPERVADRLQDESPEVIATAWLHDVLEDTPQTAESLRAGGIPESVITAVVTLTKKEGEAYGAYLARVKANPIARKVKVADMLDNLRGEPNPKQIKKYAIGLFGLVEE